MSSYASSRSWDAHTVSPHAAAVYSVLGLGLRCQWFNWNIAVAQMANPPNVVLGVTNPFFIKALDHWPHLLKVGTMSKASKASGSLEWKQGERLFS